MSEISLSKDSMLSSPKLAAAKVRLLLTELNLHFIAVALLLLVNIYLLIHLFFVWRDVKNNGPDELHNQQLQMRNAEIAAEPLRGIDAKVVHTTEQADRFYGKRLPFAISQVAAELGKLSKKEGVRQTRASYSYNPVMAGTSNELTELRIDVSLSGDYRPLVHVINALERDQLFFLISSMTLNGQQSGTVNLRLRLTTYVRTPVGDETTKALVVEEPAKPAGPAVPAPIAPARPAPMGAAAGRPMPVGPRGPLPTSPTRPMGGAANRPTGAMNSGFPNSPRRIPGQPMPGGAQR